MIINQPAIKPPTFHPGRDPQPEQGPGWEKDLYPDYDHVTADLHELADKFPDHAQLTSLGKTYEGRDIWSLRITGGEGDPDQKPGVVLTGVHHAREWASLAVPLNLAHELLEKYDSDPAIKKRVDSSELFIVPLVNPDGYEYTREVDALWRKNRQPLDPSKPDEGPLGVDPNRNYGDSRAENAWIYRLPGDTPESTADDVGASDDPNDLTFRGRQPNSSAEVQALLGLELGHKNIKGVMDHHGYGGMILYPRGATTDESPNAPIYKAIAQDLKKASGGYRILQESELYPATGGSNDVQDVNGILGMAVEMGKGWEPGEKELAKLKTRMTKADMIFIDDVLANAGQIKAS